MSHQRRSPPITKAQKPVRPDSQVAELIQKTLDLVQANPDLAARILTEWVAARRSTRRKAA